MEQNEYIDKERELLFSIRRSVRYHNHRKRFFIAVHNWAAFLAAISGTAVFATVLAKTDPTIQLLAAFFVTLFSLGDLIVASPAKAREYEDLSRRFISLEKILVLSEEKNIKLLNDINAKLLDIEADEPPHLRTLNAICFNETVKAMGLDPKASIKITWHQRLLRHILDLKPDLI